MGAFSKTFSLGGLGAQGSRVGLNVITTDIEDGSIRAITTDIEDGSLELILIDTEDI